VIPEMTIGLETKRVLTDMAANMRAKYIKYYGSFRELNPLVLIGLVLDPRFKLRHIVHLFNKEKCNEAEVQSKIKELKGLLMSLYEAYAPKNEVPKKNGEDDSSQSTLASVGTNKSRGRASIINDRRKHVQQSDEAMVSHEVDQYLLDPLEFTAANAHEFPILTWWKINGPKYPVLASIAKDVLAIQVSTVASESCFSTGGRVIDSFRCSLTPKSVEALICLQSWLRGDEICCKVEEPCIEDMDFYENIERGND
jgi:hypothetical protein